MPRHKWHVHINDVDAYSQHLKLTYNYVKTMTELILNFLRENPKSLPMLLMRKFKITLAEAKRIRELYDNEIDNALLMAQGGDPHSHRVEK